MIDPFIGMTCVAAVEAGCAFFALTKWRAALRRSETALDSAAYWEAKHNSAAARISGWQAAAEQHRKAHQEAVSQKIDVEDRLRKIEQQRSDTTRRGNLTKAARRAAQVHAKAEELKAA